jgi:predicted transcriptional regulator of viral defense system
MIKDKFKKPKAIISGRGGTIRTAEAIRSGIHPRILYEMLEGGILERLSRGLYRLTEFPPLGNPDLVSVAVRVPSGVICLISALMYHEITTQIPHEVHLAVPRKSMIPHIDFPPVRVFRFSGDAFSEGIVQQNLDNVPVRIYNPEKTLADCFKYRNKIGLDTTLEALKLYRERSNFKIDELMQFARVCRVEKVMRPYVEAFGMIIK